MNPIFFEKIKEMILKKYPSLGVTITTDDNDIIFSIDDTDVYYSIEFQLLITEINIQMLWANNIYNVLFVVEEKRKYEQMHFYSVLDNNISSINFTISQTITYKIEKAIYQSYTIDMNLEAA